jgi:hypothetical protein
VTDRGLDRTSVKVRPSIELQIEELILTGFPAGDRRRIGAAFEQELGRLLSERGLPAALGQGSDRSSLDGGSFGVGQNTLPEAVGFQIAKAVYGGFTK